MRRIQLTVAIPCVVAVAACTDVSQYPQAPQTPEPMRVSYDHPYYLVPGDTLAIKLLLNPELNEEVTVGPDGRVSTTVASNVVAAGKTIPEVADELRRAYSRDIKNPRVSVSVRSFAPTRVYVGGEVVFPGEFATANGPPLTLAQALSRAGGLKMSGDDANVFIIRRPGPGIAPEFLATHYHAIVRAKDATADVVLASGDVIYVPKTGVAEVYAWYNQYIEQFAHPSVGFTYVINQPANGGVTPITTGGTTGTTVTTTPTTTAR